jgi:hypothetical protein
MPATNRLRRVPQSQIFPINFSILLQRESPFLALSGHSNRTRVCLLLG